MPIFATAYPAYQVTSVPANAATKIYDTTSYTPAGGSALNFETPQTLHDLTLVNDGPATIYIGGSSVTTATGLPVAPGVQVTLQGWTATAGSGGVLWAITASGSAATTVEVGLASVASVV